MARAGGSPRSHDSVDSFFADLASRGTEPLLHNASGSIRFELADGARTDRVLVEVDRGAVKVSRRAGRPSAVVRADRPLFEGMVEGRVNAIASVLRGLLVIEGDLGIVMSFIRLFPGPPASVRSFLRRQRALGAAQ